MSLSQAAGPSESRPLAGSPTDPIGSAWLVTVRWTTVLAEAGAIVAGRGGLDAAVPLTSAVAVVVAGILSNSWLTVRRRTGRPVSITTGGLLVSADVLLLTWLLLRFGGVLNPASVFYLVQIVVAALVLGRYWTWIVTLLSAAGYAALFLTPTSELNAAQAMHPEIALHMKGMWLAFALTAIIIATLVTRLVIAVERRDRAIETMRDQATRASRLAGLATLAAGAAHELSTPLSTIAVAAHELERTLDDEKDAAIRGDVQLIRSEIDRCRRVLDDLAARSGDPRGGAAMTVTVAGLLAAGRARLTATEQARVDWRAGDEPIVAPVDVLARAIESLVRNGLQASSPAARVVVDAAIAGTDLRIAVVDRGVGMTPEQLARAGEPFFTTKPAGQGTGLGLFVSRETIEQLGGRLTLQSVAGEGTTATILLPRDVVAREGRDRV